MLSGEKASTAHETFNKSPGEASEGGGSCFCEPSFPDITEDFKVRSNDKKKGAGKVITP